VEREQLSTEQESAAERVALAAEVLGGDAAASRGTAEPAIAQPRRRFGPQGGAHLERTYSRDPEAFPEPNSRQELWRFAALPRLRPLLAGPAADGEVQWDWAPDAPVTRAPMTDPRVGSVHTPFDRLGAIAMAKADEAVVVSIEGELAEPVTLTAKGVGGVAYGHLVVDVAPFASAVVVVDHVGSATYAGNVDLRVGDGASLTFVTVQEWDDDAIHVEAQTACVGRDASLRHVTVTLGGDVVRLAPVVRFAGPGGDATLLGLYFADAGQHVDARLLVDHDQPRCRSRVTYKGALQGDDARSVWTGDVLIRPVAVGTDTYELNRNLLLTDGARADSVPNLEIETGEVAGAGHASATGRFDDEQLFYLMARGIPADVARRLVVRGFFADVLAAIGVPDLADRLLAAVDTKLERTIGAAR
jgi:Fe-S cluster assembly protein SufD